MKQHENIKNKILKIKSIIQRLKVFEFCFVVFMFAFFFLNLISSYTISPVYFQFINKDKTATVDFLQKINSLPEFQKILEINKNIYGKTIEKETFRQENEKKLMINNLEQQLKVNPKARDILYSLFLLYTNDGNNLTAENYLRRAKEIDPTLK